MNKLMNLTILKLRAEKLHHLKEGIHNYVMTVFFRIASESSNNFNWRCIETKLLCKAKCYTKGNTISEEYTIYFHNNEDEQHNHAPHPTKLSLFENKEKRRKLKEATMTCSKIVSNVAPMQILASVINEVKSPDAIANMPTYDADRQAINRYKKSTRPNYPPEPHSLADITVPEFLTKTLEDSSGICHQFLIYDSGKEDPRRFLVFGTLENLKPMENNNIFADGTFSISPTCFEQVYTIHAHIH
ncbi:unnamed protein product [Brachionus calyciflorus]|uniref:FLYWCH-type domain-containing protein n=1 Tax=Brachionus calyciflorus TaxID=104777 RepID=A0A814K455_9BILA|nr:unnamed protein product [Brachionus calyciflorus]